MSWSYDPTVLATSEVMQVRFILGDTVAAAPLLQDEEIEFALAQSTSVKRASLMCLTAILQKVANSAVNFRLGPYSEDHTQRLTALRQLQATLEKELSGYGVPVSNAPLTAPIFEHDLMSSPEVLSCLFPTQLS